MKKPIGALLLALSIAVAAIAWLDASRGAAEDVCVLKAAAPAPQHEGGREALRIARA